MCNFLVQLLMLWAGGNAKRLELEGGYMAMSDTLLFHNSTQREDDDWGDLGWEEQKPSPEFADLDWRANEAASDPTWKEWPGWGEKEKENPALKGLKDDKVNYKNAGDGMVKVAKGITNWTGKIQCNKEQKKVIDGVGQIAQGAGQVLMAVAPAIALVASGPAAPIVFGVAFAINLAASLMMSITETRGAQQPHFEYDFTNLDNKIKDNFNAMGWEFQLALLATQRVQASINKLAGNLYKMLNKILAKITALDVKVTSLAMKGSRSTMNKIGTIHRDLLGAISRNLTKKNATAVKLLMEPNIPVAFQEEIKLRSNFKDNLEHLLGCAACGGKAAAAIWLHRFQNARSQVWIVLWFHRMLENDYLQAQQMSDHFMFDLKSWKRTLQEEKLTAWMRLTPAQLSKYLVSASEWLELEKKIEDLRSGSWSRKRAAAHALESTEATVAAHAVSYLIPLLNPPSQAWRSLEPPPFKRKIIQPDEQKACVSAAYALRHIGYPAAWEAKPALEAVKDKRWTERPESGRSVCCPLSPCAKASLSALKLLEEQEQKSIAV